MALQLLLVEDKDRTADQILGMLDQSIYAVTRTKDGLGGLNQAKKVRYDIVLIDHKMPIMDGLTLLKNLRECPGYETTPLLFMTTDDAREIEERAVRQGATLVLGKPLDKPQLLNELKRLAPRYVA